LLFLTTVYAPEGFENVNDLTVRVETKFWPELLRVIRHLTDKFMGYSSQKHYPPNEAWSFKINKLVNIKAFILSFYLKYWNKQKSHITGKFSVEKMPFLKFFLHFKLKLETLFDKRS